MSIHSDIYSADAVVIGAGFAGATIARELAERGNMQVALIERREHIGGNAYDMYDEHGVLIHAYGPHIYHTNSDRVHEYLTRFASFNDYQHEVLANVHGSFIPVPFNLNSIDLSFSGERAAAFKQALLGLYPHGTRIGILDLKQQDDPLLKELSDYVYENVFLFYTMKQWGQTPEEIDPAVSARVPVLLDTDNRYFQDKYQGLPVGGYAALFEAMLDHPNITVHLGVDAAEILSIQVVGAADGVGAGGAGDADAEAERAEAILVDGKPYDGLVIYTGALDELLEWRYGMLPYRTLEFVYRRYNEKHVQPVGTVNYTVSEDFTRITEYSHMTGQDIDVTTVAEEYPLAFTDPSTQTPYYPISDSANQAQYERYVLLFAEMPKFKLLGRLAEYRYYNMDQIVARALELADELLS
ncbi:MAG: FAD-dependent oxidoreductase [Coriobacteriia bacterium]|nr:FAD-dependent oxidoreductase [Coriobacteriia bacterium]